MLKKSFIAVTLFSSLVTQFAVAQKFDLSVEEFKDIIQTKSLNVPERGTYAPSMADKYWEQAKEMFLYPIESANRMRERPHVKFVGEIDDSSPYILTIQAYIQVINDVRGEPISMDEAFSLSDSSVYYSGSNYYRHNFQPQYDENGMYSYREEGMPLTLWETSSEAYTTIIPSLNQEAASK